MDINSNYVKRKVFSKYEIEVFLRLCRKYKSRIEKKGTNKIANRLRRETWIAIRNEFNCVPNVEKRSENQLLQFYRNLKKKAASEKKEMQIIPTDSEPNENNESSEDSLDLRPISMSSLVLPFKSLFDIDDSEGLTIQNSTCSSDNFSLNTAVKHERDSEINDDDMVADSFVDTVLDCSEPVTDTSPVKSEKSLSPGFPNFEESYVRRKKNSTDESSSDACVPSSSKQTVTCSHLPVPSEDRTMHGPAKRESYSRDTPDSAFCRYMHTMLTTIPECFEKEKAKIQMTEILMKLKYPQE